MTRGRKPTPSSVVQLRGNPGKRKQNHNEPKPNPEIPECPSFLCQEGKEEWDRLAQKLYDSGILTGLDRSMLAAYCQAYALWKNASEKISQYGVVVKSPNGFPIQSPYVAILNKQVELMVKLASEFGMTPASRTRIKLEKPDVEDSFEAFLNRKR